MENEPEVKKIKVVFSQKMVADSGNDKSPSAHKPGLMAQYLKDHPISDPALEPEFVEPEAVSVEDICRCHAEAYVKDVLALKQPNGFGTLSQSVADSLPYTNGSMYTAAKIATKDMPAVSLSSGFHHAEWHGQPRSYSFCTFNGLMIAAVKLVQEGMKNVAIVDCDMHYGNGTDDIIRRFRLRDGLPELKLGLGEWTGSYYHSTFGYFFGLPRQAPAYLANIQTVRSDLKIVKPNVIIYQSGADVHVDDPQGGVLTEEEMYKRDVEIFKIAKDLQIPLAWNLAGGYQIAADGSIDKVLKLHWNTFKACAEVFSASEPQATT